MADARPANPERDRRLFGPGRKRILSIDGGGVRGVLALGYLARLERHLSEQAGSPVKLCEHFDLIGGTSTGAIIATALALGHTVAEIRDFYLRLGPSVFRRPLLRLPGWQSKFDARALSHQLTAIVGDRTLDTPDLKTGLGVMLKRIDNGSSWILTNNPRSPFWEHPPDGSYIGNCDYSLARIVRASTAAPHYFDPQEIEIVKGGPAALFVDGGLTPHNDPSLALYLAAVLPGNGLGWAHGADKLTIVSIGTGAVKVHLTLPDLRRASAVTIALRALMQQISDNQRLTLTLMSWLGAGGAPWPINLEIGDLRDVLPPFGALFRFLRYDVKLDAVWLRDALGVTLTAKELARIDRFDDPAAMKILDDLGQKAAARQMSARDLADA